MIKIIKLLVFMIVGLASITYCQLSKDAIELTLRIQDCILLDSALAKSIDSSLVSARATNDSLSIIHAGPRFVNNMVIVKTTATWAQNWQQGSLTTGQSYIDSLGSAYKLAAINATLSHLGDYALMFSVPLQAEKLALLYKSAPGVTTAYQNSTFGTVHDIDFCRKSGVDYLAFSFDVGDMDGTATIKRWYISVSNVSGERDARFVETTRGDIDGPHIHRWNLPEKYEMTMFANLDSILSAVSQGSDWWVRKHAIEGLSRFFSKTAPWAELDTVEKWDALKTEVLSRKLDVQGALKKALSDNDSSVRASAGNALVVMTSTTSEATLDIEKAMLLESAPNPFNPTTQLSFTLPKAGYVTLSVFDASGRQVATIVNTAIKAGFHSVHWNGSGMASGMYVFKLQVGNRVETKKAMLTR